MKLYAWISDPHEGEPEPYPMSFVHPEMGVMAMFSTHRALVQDSPMRAVAEQHARANGCQVRLVEAEVNDTLEIIDGAGGPSQ